jgi:hypothetical protein
MTNKLENLFCYMNKMRVELIYRMTNKRENGLKKNRLKLFRLMIEGRRNIFMKFLAGGRIALRSLLSRRPVYRGCYDRDFICSFADYR